MMHFNAFGCIWDWPAGFFLPVPSPLAPRYVSSPGGAISGCWPFSAINLLQYVAIVSSNVITCYHWTSLDICNSQVKTPPQTCKYGLVLPPHQTWRAPCEVFWNFPRQQYRSHQSSSSAGMFWWLSCPQHPSDFQTTSGHSSGQKVKINMNYIIRCVLSVLSSVIYYHVMLYHIIQAFVDSEISIPGPSLRLSEPMKLPKGVGNGAQSWSAAVACHWRTSRHV